MEDSSKTIILSVSLTFVIGVVAGIAPFVFMQLLPTLLNPELEVTPPNYAAIIWTGLLIGAITSIIFTKTFKSYDPKDIFFYALGIPAILIATVSNVSTKFDAAGQISQVKANSSSTVLSTPAPEKFDSVPVRLSPPPGIKQESSLLTSVWAAEPPAESDSPSNLGDYLIVIGEYLTEKEAWAAYSEYNKKRLRTETYVPKNLGVYQLDKNKYILVYGRYSTQAEAEKVFKLLKINDLGINVRLMQPASSK